MHMTVNIDRYIEDMEQWKKTKEENERLQQELQRKDNIIESIKELLEEYDTKIHLDDTIYIDKNFKRKLEEIINGN